MIIALDWGTSSLRAYLLDRDGGVLGREHAAAGIQGVAGSRFRETFESVCGRWLAREPRIAVIASGMIGSRQGWREAAYVEAPAGFFEIARGLLRIDDDAGRPFALVPGVSCVLPSGTHDVMRGEETQVFGALDAARDDATVVLPGTHSKWVEVRDGRIVSFRTYLTGELYAVLARHSILGRLFPDGGGHADEDNDEDSDEDDGAGSRRAFADGVARGLADPGGLASLLFSVRSEGLFGAYAAAALPSYLSGVLIGAEVGHALRNRAAPSGAPARRLVVVGDPALQRRYLRALGHAGVAALAGPADAAATGLARIAREAGLLVR